jgi:hypothetical protein
MFRGQGPSAIVWTETAHACPIEAYYQLPATIGVVTSWVQLELDLARIRDLGEDWDGFGAPAPDQAVLERASSFLRVLQERDASNPPSGVVLSPSGSVALEWLEGNSFLRAEIEDSNDIEWMLSIPGQPTDFKIESLIQPASDAVECQEWEPAPAPVGEPVYASAH